MAIELNRAQRRQLERVKKREAADLPEYKKREMRARAAVLERLSKNGITPEDLKKEYDKGFDEGFRRAAEPIICSVYAAICLALHELHGFGPKRCKDVLRQLDSKILYTLDGSELVQQVMDDVGLAINFKEPFDRIEDREAGA